MASRDPWFGNFRPASRADAETAFTAWLATTGADIPPQPKPRTPAPPECNFDRFTHEQRQAWGRMGGLHSPRARAAERHGFTPAEFAEFGRIIAKGFNSDEAAEIVLRSRRPAPEAGER